METAMTSHWSWILALLLVTPTLSGCGGRTETEIDYLGDDVQRPAHELEAGEVRSEAPALARAMEKARNASDRRADLDFDEVESYVISEIQEEEGCANYTELGCPPYESRFNWTGSTFRISQHAIN